MGTIEVKNLGKAYKVYPSRFSRLKEWLIPFSKKCHDIKWVLQDINFTVKSGGAIGIIGINGAGKSTLLKMLTGTTQPTTGTVSTVGRVAALLELGIGFHPEFSGRQNAVMAGQLLGYTIEDINRLMPEIEAFAEIGDYIEQPVRVYSSGMQMRLAFSVATAIRPDILIIDEALSVGDAHFQHKSFDRIRQFRKEGTTLLIVSHDKQAIQSICDKAILLDSGHLALEGDPETVMDYYNALVVEKDETNINIVSDGNNEQRVISGNSKAFFTKINITDENSNQIEVLKVGQNVSLVAEVEISETVKRLVFGYQIKDRAGLPIYGTSTHYTSQPVINCMPGDKLRFTTSFSATLGPGTYSIAASLVDTDGVQVYENYEWRERVLTLSVINTDAPHFIGCAWIPPKIEICKL